MIPTSSVAVNPSASHNTKLLLRTYHLMLAKKGPCHLRFQLQVSSITEIILPPFSKLKVPPSLTHSTQDTPLVYTFAPPKAPTVTHHAPSVCTYVTAPPVTKAQEF
ncbi:hypothetical protein KY285_023535 [Solanum tuberosum]|nr:hypothetical protein KY289_023868 [Solanum tuberosum]KAH0675734.1 hypothetical protein KY285_023535 [Solanum tuberosum]